MGKNPSLAETAYRTVRDWILSGQYTPGTPLTRRPIAARLGMSLIPVTEALQRLEADGLVESLPRIGTRVRIPTAEQIRGHYDLRQALETQSARLFCERATAAERERLIRLARRVDKLYGGLDRSRAPKDSPAQRSWGGESSPALRAPRPVPASYSERLFRAHQEHAKLHVAIARATRSKPLIEALERSHVIIFNWLYNTAANIEHHPADWHVGLAEVLVQSDPQKADQAMRYHTRYGMEEVIARITAHPSQNGHGGSFRGPQRRTLAKPPPR